MSQPGILVAGIGNIFLGDDGFGVEVVQVLAQRPLPDSVRVVDYGIRGYDLAFALLDGPGQTILVDALPGGEPPGTITVLEADPEVPNPAQGPDHGQGAFAGHSMTPQAVFGLVRALGGQPGRVLVVGCEPATFGEENQGRMGLSEAVAAAVPEAVATVERLLQQIGATADVSPVTGGARGA